jgi:hypothetical protein
VALRVCRGKKGRKFSVAHQKARWMEPSGGVRRLSEELLLRATRVVTPMSDRDFGRPELGGMHDSMHIHV